ncbi:hypothetical protein Bbelb_431670 [Branchiostoma belcheri]|nr:hypothetical protein Bbelb_431670 [Branchiostoma belcheri]
MFPGSAQVLESSCSAGVLAAAAITRTGSRIMDNFPMVDYATSATFFLKTWGRSGIDARHSHGFARFKSVVCTPRLAVSGCLHRIRCANGTPLGTSHLPRSMSPQAVGRTPPFKILATGMRKEAVLTHASSVSRTARAGHARRSYSHARVVNP